MDNRLRPRDESTESSNTRSILAVVGLVVFLVFGLIVGPRIFGPPPLPEDDLMHLVTAMSGDQQLTLLPGDFPSDLPRRIPLPPDSTLVGSIILPEWNNTRIFIEVPDVTEARAYYRQHFIDEGLQPAEPALMPTFVTTAGQEFTPALTFCGENESIRLSSFSQPTIIEVTLFGEQYFNCGPSAQITTPLSALTLTHPPTATTAWASSHPPVTSADDATTFTNLNLRLPDADPAAILTHYDEQIQTAGWQQTELTATTGTWQTTTDEGETWEMRFVINQHADDVTIIISGERTDA